MNTIEAYARFYREVVEHKGLPHKPIAEELLSGKVSVHEVVKKVIEESKEYDSPARTAANTLYRVLVKILRATDDKTFNEWKELFLKEVKELGYRTVYTWLVHFLEKELPKDVKELQPRPNQPSIASQPPSPQKPMEEKGEELKRRLDIAIKGIDSLYQ